MWRPGAEGDLAVQMMEWWAYLADILTFYNERIGTQAYLGTADLPESVDRLIQLLGYRPRPGFGASGTLAGAADGPKPWLLPQGLQVQSKPGPGQQPQIFELNVATTVQKPAMPYQRRPAPASAPLLSADGTTLRLAGKVGSIKAGERLLLVNAGAVTGGTVYGFRTGSLYSRCSRRRNCGRRRCRHGGFVHHRSAGTARRGTGTRIRIARSGHVGKPVRAIGPSGITVIGSSGIDRLDRARSWCPARWRMLEVTGTPSDAPVATRLVTVHV